MTRSIKEIEHTFEKHLTTLKAVRKTILDVRVTSWHDDYNKFRSGIKDLEVMIQNVINTAFTTVTTVQEGVEFLEVFSYLTTREVCSPCSALCILYVSTVILSELFHYAMSQIIF